MPALARPAGMRSGSPLARVYIGKCIARASRDAGIIKGKRVQWTVRGHPRASLVRSRRGGDATVGRRVGTVLFPESPNLDVRLAEKKANFRLYFGLPICLLFDRKLCYSELLYKTECLANLFIYFAFSFEINCSPAIFLNPVFSGTNSWLSK